MTMSDFDGVTSKPYRVLKNCGMEDRTVLPPVVTYAGRKIVKICANCKYVERYDSRVPGMADCRHPSVLTVIEPVKGVTQSSMYAREKNKDFMCEDFEPLWPEEVMPVQEKKSSRTLFWISLGFIVYVLIMVVLYFVSRGGAQ